MGNSKASRPERAAREQRRGGRERAGDRGAVGGGPEGPPAGIESHRALVAPHHGRPVCCPSAELAGRLEHAPQFCRSATGAGELDLELLNTLIVQQWAKTLKGPYDWGDWPLARYTLGSDLLRALEWRASIRARHGSSVAHQLAWACAMVACGRATRLRSLDPRPLLVTAEGHQQERPDGALGWRCNLERDRPSGPQLRYWIHPSGLVEFDAVEFDQPSERDESCPT